MTSRQSPETSHRPNYWILATVILLPALLRWTGQPWNLTPVGGIALFAGAYIRQTRWAIAIPLAAMLLSDLTWGMIRGDLLIYTFHSLIPFVYGAYAIYVFLGRRVRSHWDRLDAHDSTAKQQAFRQRALNRGVPLGLATVGSSLLFYLITNFGMWLMYTTYPHTPAGLMECYVAGLPFLRPTITGDAFYTALIFGGYALIQIVAAQPAIARQLSES